MTPERVAEVSGRWLWYPEGAQTVETEEFLLVRFPDWFEKPPVLLRFEPSRPVAVVLDEALAAARGWGVDSVVAWSKLDASPDLDEVLLGRGAEPLETLDVLALDLTGARPPVDAGVVELKWASDLATARAECSVGSKVFGGQVPADDELRTLAARTASTAPIGAGGSLVAHVDGEPAGTGGLSVGDGAARLWGGAVLPQYRGRGVYRALLAARLSYAEQHGLTMALVKGRVETSGPILRAAGFTAYGQERSYLVRL